MGLEKDPCSHSILPFRSLLLDVVFLVAFKNVSVQAAHAMSETSKNCFYEKPPFSLCNLCNGKKKVFLFLRFFLRNFVLYVFCFFANFRPCKFFSHSKIAVALMLL